MLYIYISPAKKMSKKYEGDFVTTKPIYLDKVLEVVNVLKNYDKNELMKSMKISEVLANNTLDYYQNFNQEIVPSLFKYDGLVYKNISPNTLDNEALLYLKEHLLIGSGLYGLLHAFDGISSYRLELNKPLKEFKNLEEYYTEKISTFFNEDDVIINLASEEYSRLISKVKCSVININFLKKNNDKCSMLQTHGKIYRGQMVRYLASNNILDINNIKDFFDPNLKYIDSNENNINFIEI